MNAPLLREDLEKELTAIFKDRRYDSSRGPVPVNIFHQWAPIKESGSLEDLLPYIIIRINGAKTETPQSGTRFNVTFIAGSFDESDENRGYLAVEEILETIIFHFIQTPLFGPKRFRFVYPVEWVHQDEESYPYFFGGCNCEFIATPPIYTKASELT